MPVDTNANEVERTWYIGIIGRNRNQMRYFRSCALRPWVGCGLTHSETYQYSFVHKRNTHNMGNLYVAIFCALDRLGGFNKAGYASWY